LLSLVAVASDLQADYSADNANAVAAVADANVQADAAADVNGLLKKFLLKLLIFLPAAAGKVADVAAVCSIRT
jgi:hypothetical protein